MPPLGRCPTPAAWCSGPAREAYGSMRKAWARPAHLGIWSIKRLCSHPALRLKVVRHLYQMRFQETLDSGLTLHQIRGKEGIRVREAYIDAVGTSPRRTLVRTAAPDHACFTAGLRVSSPRVWG